MDFIREIFIFLDNESKYIIPDNQEINIVNQSINIELNENSNIKKYYIYK